MMTIRNLQRVMLDCAIAKGLQMKRDAYFKTALKTPNRILGACLPHRAKDSAVGMKP